jgi:molybdopterin/thiamine biosynthesis adenylyltransferase
VSRVTIIDQGHYEPANLRGQDIDACDVGTAKAVVQANRLRAIDPALPAAAIVGRLEDLPLGALRADLIVACVDSRRARLAINQAAWRLGIPWIDAGVLGQSQLARVQVFVPGGDAAPCLECAWDQADYDAVEQTYACAGEVGAAPTNASSGLGALAAAIQMIECEKVLAGNLDSALVGRNVVVDALHHRHYVTSFRRNPECRMPDHEGWRIERLDTSAAGVTVREAFQRACELDRAGADTTFGVAGQRLALALACPGCGASTPAFLLERAVGTDAPACAKCGRALHTSGFYLHDAVAMDAVPRSMLDVTLADVGLTAADVFALTTPSATTYYEIGGRS